MYALRVDEKYFVFSTTNYYGFFDLLDVNLYLEFL